MEDLCLLNDILVMRELARRRYSDYLALVHGKSWVATRMSSYLADQVQAFLEQDTGNAYDILVIETPPQHGKTMTITESLPSWIMGKYPDWRIILGSYNDESAERFARRNKEKIREFGHQLFGVEIGRIDRATEFELANHTGRLISRGIMSGVTGNPANVMIIDDPVKNRTEADSPTYRKKLWDEWVNSFKSRLAARAKVIVIMTPWHEADIAATMLQTEDNIRLIRLPVEAEMGDPLGRAPGEPLCPELGKGKKWLEQFKKSYLSDPQGGQRAWTALYQCSPRVEGGNLVHRDWWKLYDPSETILFGTEVISVDAAFKGAENNDFVAITVWGKHKNDYYLRYCLNRHLDFTQTLDAIRQVRTLYPNARTVLIEDKANGSAIINVLQKEMFCVPVNPKGGKVARVNAVSAAIESGHVYVPQDAPWLGEYLDQWSAFPAGAHDDMCLVAGTLVATLFGDKPIEEIRVGEQVWTPFGLRKVTYAWQTGVKPVVTRMGVTGTSDHPVFDRDMGYVPLQNLTPAIHYDTLSIKGVIRWKYQKLLYSMVWNTGLWDPVDIISVSRVAMKDDDTQKDFMWRFGSFIQARQFRKATRFITSMATLLTTTLATWSVYRCANIVRCTSRKILRSKESILKKFGRWHQRGTVLLKDLNGTVSTLRRVSVSESQNSVFASFAEKSLNQPAQQKSGSARTTARSNGTTWRRPGPRPASVKSAEPSSKQNLLQETPQAEQPVVTLAEQSCENADAARPVFNLTVEQNHLYYAGGFLVHNCDSSSQALSYLLYSNGDAYYQSKREENDTAMLEQEKERFLDGSIYDVYGGNDIY